MNVSEPLTFGENTEYKNKKHYKEKKDVDGIPKSKQTR